MDIVSVVVTVCQRLDIGLCDSRLLANLFCNMCIASSSGRSNSQQTNPSANIFLQRSADLLSKPNSARPSFTIVEIGAATTCTPPSPNSWNGSSVVNCALSKSLFWNESVSIKTIALGFRFSHSLSAQQDSLRPARPPYRRE